MRAKSPCKRHGCPHVAVRLGLCEADAADFERHRGTTSARGYGAAHQAARAGYEPAVAEGTVICWRCGHLIEPGEAWDLGHDENRVLQGPEHASGCNRRAAGLRAHGKDFRPLESRTEPPGPRPDPRRRTGH